MKRLVVDVDNTLTLGSGGDYANAPPNVECINRLADYQKQGFEIVLFTSRNMRTYEGNIGKINANTLPVLLDWLAKHDVPFDEILVGKPWCGFDGFYVDDRAIRPSEFVNLSYEQILELIENEKAILEG